MHGAAIHPDPSSSSSSLGGDESSSPPPFGCASDAGLARGCCCGAASLPSLCAPSPTSPPSSSSSLPSKSLPSSSLSPPAPREAPPPPLPPPAAPSSLPGRGSPRSSARFAARLSRSRMRASCKEMTAQRHWAQMSASRLYSWCCRSVQPTWSANALAAASASLCVLPVCGAGGAVWHFGHTPLARAHSAPNTYRRGCQ